MKKIGFTLAEVLVTLGIVGVLSALTIPTLVKNNQNQVFAKSLSSAISDFENAMSAMIVKENVYNLYETKAWTDVMMTDGIKTVLNAKPASLPTGIKSLTGDVEGVPTDFSGDNTTTLETKKGYIYHIVKADFQTNKDIDAINNGVSLVNTAANVLIDINGVGSPNRIGRDVFGFLLGNDGILYPYGGRDVAYKLGTDKDDIWSKSEGTYTCDGGVYKANGLGCTARLIDNNYKMDY